MTQAQESIKTWISIPRCNFTDKIELLDFLQNVRNDARSLQIKKGSNGERKWIVTFMDGSRLRIRNVDQSVTPANAKVL